jgi:hypothetical protein
MLLYENGYHDVPAGKIAAITTSLEMFARPALRLENGSAEWRLRQIEQQPDVSWFRDLYRRIGAGRP